jgi:hypothetical protein
VRAAQERKRGTAAGKKEKTAKEAERRGNTTGTCGEQKKKRELSLIAERRGRLWGIHPCKRKEREGVFPCMCVCVCVRVIKRSVKAEKRKQR